MSEKFLFVLPRKKKPGRNRIGDTFKNIMSAWHFLPPYVTCIFMVTSLHLSVGNAFNDVCFTERPSSGLGKVSDLLLVNISGSSVL